MTFIKRTIISLLMLLGTALTAQKILGSLLVNVGAVACTREVVSMRFNVASLFENTPPVPDSNHCISSLPFFREAAAWDSHNAQAQGWLGMASLLQKKYVDTYDHLLSGLGMVPNNSVAGFRIGVALYKLGRTEDAIAQWRGLGAERIFVGAGDAARNETKLSQAEQYYRLALRIVPGSAEAHLGLAEIFFTAHQWEKALSEYDEAFKLGLQSAQGAYHQALTFAALGRFHEALLASERAIQWDRDYPIYLVEKGEVYSLMGNYAEAESIIGQAVARWPTLGLPHWALGNNFKRQGKFDDAIREFRLATEKDPEMAYFWASLGDVYLSNLHDLDMSIKFYTEATVLNRNNPQYHLALGFLYEAKGDLPQAIREYSRALELNPDDSSVRQRLEEVTQRLRRTP